MMFPVIDKILDLVKRLVRNRQHSLFPFKAEGEEIYRVLLASLAMAPLFATGSAGLCEGASHQVGQLSEKPFFACVSGYKGLLPVCSITYSIPYKRSSVKRGG